MFILTGMVAGCAQPRQVIVPLRTNLAQDCEREGRMTADAWSRQFQGSIPLGLSSRERVGTEAEAACMARPLSAAELEHQQRQQQEAEAREARERERRAEEERREAERRERERQMQAYRAAAATACGVQVESMMALAMASPFAIEGRCFEIVTIGVNQWLSPTRALVLDYSVLFESERPMSSPPIGTTIVRGIGDYTYQTATGATRTIPHVRQVAVSQRN